MLPFTALHQEGAGGSIVPHLSTQLSFIPPTLEDGIWISSSLSPHSSSTMPGKQGMPSRWEVEVSGPSCVPRTSISAGPGQGWRRG